MNIQTVRFVSSSELWEGYPSVRDAFQESDPDMSWGNNNYTLASKDMFLKAIESLDDAPDEMDQDEFDDAREVVENRIKALPDDIYVDLES